MDRLMDELVRGIARESRGLAEIRPTDITDDSRSVTPGAIFLARRGVRSDGNRFLAHAIDAGASVLVTDDPAAYAHAAPHPAVLVADAAHDGARIAERFFGDPSRTLRLLAVTGTNGKTTVATLTRQLLEASGVRCGLIGTIEIDGAGERSRSRLTTPGAIELSRTLARMVDEGCLACAMEASSHALHQGRLAGVRIATAIFTNLSGDHLDYHGTLDRYADAKAILFERLDPDATAIFNTQDPAWRRMSRDCSAIILRCGDREPSRVDILRSTLGGMTLRLTGPFGVLTTRVPFVGAHNAMNLLQAALAASTLGLDAHDLAQAMPRLASPRGRLERVPGPSNAPTVLVDFAHTDDALANALSAVRGSMEGGRLIVVFGCGGDRDRTKRPRMGAVAERFADLAIITSDNPRTEDPDAILAEVASGLVHRERAVLEVDRARAIERAIGEAKPGDVVVIAGKGHETEQILPDGHGGTYTVHFDDVEVAERALAARWTPDVRTPGARERTR